MIRDAENGHHDLMDSMPEMNGERREQDFLSEVGEMAAEAEQKAPAAVDMDTPVGARVRQVREQRELSIRDVSQRTGLDEDFLREIEEQKVNPPLGVLAKLGKALDMTMGTFISSGQERPYAIVRAQERKDMSRYPHTRETSYGYSYQALAPLKKNRSMEPFMVTLTGSGMGVEPSTHSGEEFIFVMQGEMEAVVGDAMEILKPGDCIYYDSTEPHLLRPHGQGPTLILAVIYSQDR